MGTPIVFLHGNPTWSFLWRNVIPRMRWKLPRPVVLHIHHDALEFPDGKIVLLTRLCEGQKATVLTLPTQPKPAAEAEVQHRVAYVG